MSSWSEIWTRVERREPERLLQRWLAALRSSRELDNATRAAFAADPDQYARELISVIAKSARHAEHVPLRSAVPTTGACTRSRRCYARSSKPVGPTTRCCCQMQTTPSPLR
jgi:hypothetical protein